MVKARESWSKEEEDESATVEEEENLIFSKWGWQRMRGEEIEATSATVT